MSRKSLVAFAVGVLFALGLGIGGMTDPAKSFGFFDVGGLLAGSWSDWDPTLAFVMAGALIVYLALYQLAVRRAAPVFGESLEIPTRRDIDRRLVVGALLFGAGWGLSGFCPGPGLTSLVTGNSAVLVFVLAMTAGMFLHEGFDRLLAGRPWGSWFHRRVRA